MRLAILLVLLLAHPAKAEDAISRIESNAAAIRQLIGDPMDAAVPMPGRVVPLPLPDATPAPPVPPPGTGAPVVPGDELGRLRQEVAELRRELAVLRRIVDSFTPTAPTKPTTKEPR